MLLARVVGHATSTIKHPTMQGVRLLLCETISETGEAQGGFFLAADWIGAGHGACVYVSTDGSAAEAYHHKPDSPIRNTIMGIAESFA
ncbi:MAG: EutN/CcmL family microcompartment protein [Verrucomicrobiota bacterium JB022]|nr:EutN/CcmL family microcompartment protein [Verrucomicrobiota bacterium JB022]